jgi:hypothetical protein
VDMLEKIGGGLPVVIMFGDDYQLPAMGKPGLNLDNRNFESVTDFHSVCYVYGRLGGRNRLFRAQVR